MSAGWHKLATAANLPAGGALQVSVGNLGDGALMMPYEKLINPPVVESRALHWPWEKVKRELDKLEALGKRHAAAFCRRGPRQLLDKCKVKN
jgi:hypothetical protein